MSVRQATLNILQQVRATDDIQNRLIGQEIKLTGVSFDNRQNIIGNVDSRTNIALVREPDNEFDANAIAVCLVDSNEKIGYIPMKLNQSLAKLMDEGADIKARIKRVVSAYGKSTSGVIILVEKEETNE